VGGVAALILLPETRAARSGLDDPLAEENSLRLRANRDLWVVASLHGLNRFVTAGVLTATLALLVQDRLSSVGPTLGVATLTGVLMAGRTLLSMVAAPLAGTASDRLGSRWGVAAWGLAVGVVSMALVAWGEPLAILAGVSLGAVAGGSIQALAMALTGDLVSQAQRGRAIGLLHTAGDLGSAVGPPAAYVLMSWLELKGVYLLCAGLFAAGLALAMLFRPRTTAPP